MGGTSSGKKGTSFNGDAFADVVVGAPPFPGNESQGQVFVYVGGPNGLATTPIVLNSPTGSINFGWAASPAGDVDGDGFDDLFVGTFGEGAGGMGDGTGRAYLYKGSPAPVATDPATTLAGMSLVSHFGYVLSGAGDVNGDGFSDVVVADRYKAFVHFGSAAGLSSVGTVLPITAEGDGVAGAGDVNGDGFADVLIGGALYLGTAAGISTSSSSTLTLGGAVPGSLRVAGVGDVNADGLADAVLMSCWNGMGSARVFYGSTGGLSDASSTSLGIPVDAPKDCAVAGAHDVDGDGFDDVVMCADGVAVVYRGSPSGVGATPPVTLSDSSGGLPWCDVAGAGDVDGDGYADVVVGRVGMSNTQGQVSLHMGGPSGISVAPAVTIQNTAWDFGLTVTGVR